LTFDELIMQRCLQLAEMGKGFVAPNPLVGSVLVHNNTIIGEGYHQLYGNAHAEVNCLASVPMEKRHLITESTLYVSLEPCAHWGKTPPCANLIIANKIPKVVIGCSDSYFEVAGKGIQLLQNAGIEVNNGVLEKECKAINKHFFTFHEKKRPFITLKWAESADKFIGKTDERIIISNIRPY
jgi:diaminohydroxyphosphoribosylaminopyrimidine deaminase / 5-amino-6-(5-phosphoribosylamino)uracil reductase